jgi:hypothetical protein
MKLETETVQVPVPGHNKSVRLTVPTEVISLKTAFNEMTTYVAGLSEQKKIRDLEAGIDPQGATHEITKTRQGDYVLNRTRFG